MEDIQQEQPRLVTVSALSNERWEPFTEKPIYT